MPHDFSGSLSSSTAAALWAPPRSFLSVQDPALHILASPTGQLLKSFSLLAQEEEEKDLELEDVVPCFPGLFPQD